MEMIYVLFFNALMRITIFTWRCRLHFFKITFNIEGIEKAEWTVNYFKELTESYRKCRSVLNSRRPGQQPGGLAPAILHQDGQNEGDCNTSRRSYHETVN